MSSSAGREEFARSKAAVRVKISDESGPIFEGESCDVSLTGLRVWKMPSMPVGARCSVALALECGDDSIAITTRGMVGRQAGEYTGIVFTEVESENLELLRKLSTHNKPDGARRDDESGPSGGAKPVTPKDRWDIAAQWAD